MQIFEFLNNKEAIEFKEEMITKLRPGCLSLENGKLQENESVKKKPVNSQYSLF